jgi:LuxR family transcriptional regulator, transcriptional activator of the bioluminescence operon
MNNTSRNPQFFSESQRQVTSLEEVKSLCEKFTEIVGFEHYLFGICRPTSLSAPEISTITNYPESWIKTYFESSFQSQDPVVRYCFENVTPIRWDQLLQLDDYLTPAAEHILSQAAHAGLAHGLSIPLRSHNGDFAIFSLATASGEDIENRFEKLLPLAHAFSTELFGTVMRININNKTQTKENLTPRELECLFWACEGKTTWEISKIINVTERTVIFHLTSATKKLGAVNRQHAVAKAMASGLIKPRV